MRTHGKIPQYKQDRPERFVNAFTLGAFFATLDGQGPCEIEMPHCQKILKPWRGIQYVEHIEGDGVEIFKAICKLGLEGIVSKKLDAPYKSGPSRAWLRIKNPKAPAATRATDGTF